MDNSDRVGRARRLLKSGLAPFVSREFVKHYGGRSAQELRRILREPVQDAKGRFATMDAAGLLRVMERSWNEVFRRHFDHGERNTGQTERGLVLELQEVRIRSAHDESFSSVDAYRALDSTHRLLTAIPAPKEAGEVDSMKVGALRALCEELGGALKPGIPKPPSRSSKPRNWAEPGTINHNQQENLGRVLPWRQSPKTGQYIHRMKCLVCGGEYHSWSGDIHHHKCPYCDGGALGPDLSEGDVVS